MTSSLPIVFIGDFEKSQDFFKSVFLSNEDFKFYNVPPVRAIENESYRELISDYSNLIVGPGTAGCSLAHLQAQKIIHDHIKDQNINLDLRESYNSRSGGLPIYGGLVFESDAKLSDYGNAHFLNFIRSLGECSFKLIQLGGLKSTSGREGQKINWKNSMRNFFMSNIVHDLKEDLFEKLNFAPKVVSGWIGGSHAYYIHSDAIEVLAKNHVGFINAIDDYFRVISWNTSWVGRTRQNLFIQSETTSLINELGR